MKIRINLYEGEDIQFSPKKEDYDSFVASFGKKLRKSLKLRNSDIVIIEVLEGSKVLYYYQV